MFTSCLIGGFGIAVPLLLLPFWKENDVFHDPVPNISLEALYRASIPPGIYPKSYNRFLDPDLTSQEWMPAVEESHNSYLHAILSKIPPKTSPSISTTSTSLHSRK